MIGTATLSRRVPGNRPIITTALALLMICVSGALATPKLFLWNASASVPEGLYFVLPHAKPRVGDLAVSDLPADMQRLAAERHYLPRGVVLIKPVRAVAGMTVCRIGADISVDGHQLGTALHADRLHRAMPEWTGCRHLKGSDIFLMNPAVGESFDGRYFGPTSIGLVLGRAFPLLTFSSRSDSRPSDRPYTSS